MIELKYLPREVRDRLSIKEETEITFFRALEEDYSDVFFDTLDERKKKDVLHSYIADIHGTQGSGKTYAGLFICGYLQNNFSTENIFFDYNKLINNRKNLKQNTAVLMDEQATPYGVDSGRIGIILRALREQLRKKSIHFVFCSPTLREYATSMYVLETMFIDTEYKENYVAYKTNQLQCLGYVVIPHPLKVIRKKMLLDYEKLKDEHLEELTDKPVDDIEERTKLITQDPVFKKAEEVYCKKIGFIPYRNLVQVINKMFPEFKGSVIVYELADRIRVNKELSGDWDIAGRSWQKRKTDAEDKRDKRSMKPDDKNSGGSNLFKSKGKKKIHGAKKVRKVR